MGWRLPPGTLESIYAKVAKDAGVTDGRDELARRTKIPATNLSGVNSGKRDMTVGYAKRIAEAAGVSPVELGAPLEEGDARGRLIFDRLEDLEAVVNRLGPETDALDLRVSALETQALPSKRRSGSPRDRPKQ